MKPEPVGLDDSWDGPQMIGSPSEEKDQAGATFHCRRRMRMRSREEVSHIVMMLGLTLVWICRRGVAHALLHDCCSAPA
jgi:hypothetical protein